MKIALFAIILVFSLSQNVFAGWKKKALAVGLVAGGCAAIYAAKGEDESVRNALVSISAGLAVVGITYLWKSDNNAQGLEKFDNRQKLLWSRFSHNTGFLGSGGRLRLTGIIPTYKPTFVKPKGWTNGRGRGANSQGRIVSPTAHQQRLSSFQGLDKPGDGTKPAWRN